MREPISKMEYSKIVMGLIQWANEDICIAGGMRCPGFHPPGKLRMKFMAYGVPELKELGQDAAEFGHIEVHVNLNDDEPTIDGLIVLEVKRDKRGKGYGSRIVEGVLAATKGDLKIWDIKRSAVGFWKKMGVEFEGGRDGRPPSKGKIDGVIKHPGYIQELVAEGPALGF